MSAESRVLSRKGAPVLCVPLVLAVLGLSGFVGGAEIPEEFKVKRQEVFEFTEKPVVTRAGDKVTITFTSKAFCDATVAIENADGKIIRHLASGVLGPNAPAPFQRNSLKQVVIWDGKNDKGEYIDDKDNLTIRVSLGLKPRFERTLYWSPYKKLIGWLPLMRAAPEGVYVADGATDGLQLRLLDHEGNYVRTVYPFRADQIERVGSLKWGTFPPDNIRVPLRHGTAKTTFLPGGMSAMTVQGDYAYLVGSAAARISTGASLEGSDVELARVVQPGVGGSDGLNTRPTEVTPWSVAVSPDGKWLYCTGYPVGCLHGYYGGWSWLPGVVRAPLDRSGEAAPFLGVMKAGKDSEGSDNAHFNIPIAVACDPQGRVYVADYMNNRVQVFSPEGKHLKSIAVERPAELAIHPKTGELYVFSWCVSNVTCNYAGSGGEVRPALRQFGPFDDPAPRATYPLDLGDRDGRRPFASVTLDFWTNPPRLWVLGDPGGYTVDWHGRGVRIFALKDRKLELKRDFGAEAAKAVVRGRPPGHSRWRLYCNPVTGKVYVGEDHFPAAIVVKGFSSLVELDPNTGKVRIVDIPFDSEDMAFDIDGHAYLRTIDQIARFDSQTWREVPFDYGEECPSTSYQGLKAAKAVSVVTFAGGGNASSQMGGMWVSPRGDVVIATCNPNPPSGTPVKFQEKNVHTRSVQKYEVRIFPGRAANCILHAFDKHGKWLYEDAVPGVGFTEGIAIDKDDSIYLMAVTPGNINGKPYPDPAACTLVKVRPNSKVYGEGVVPMAPADRPKRVPDVFQWRDTGSAWFEKVEWTFPGVGLDTQNYWSGSGKCHCLGNSRFALDYFGRSFAPELARCDVVVIDAAGNAIVRVGRYGNVDDGLPSVKDGGPPNPRPIGGDEVSLLNPRFVATHTDRRLFIGDRGNERVLSIRLSYHVEEKVALKGIPDGGP